MNEKINKTTICSIVFLDIIDYSKKSVSEQIDIKNQFNLLINHSLKDTEPDDRIILDTGDGAAIAHMGSPEDALFISLSIRDEVLKNNILSSMPLYVRFGINLGPVRLVRDINGQPNIIGDGINVAQRIMSFAKPNQIVVSRSYYDVTSRLTQEISQMFDYSGIKHDKHVREHEIYAVRLLKDTPIAETKSAQLSSLMQPAKQLFNPFNWFDHINWKYTLLALPAVLTFVMVIKDATMNHEPVITLEKATLATPPKLAVTKVLASVAPNDPQLLPNESVEPVPAQNIEIASQQEKTPVKTKITLQKTEKKLSKKAQKTVIADLPPEFVLPANDSAAQPKSATKSAEPSLKTAAIKVEKSKQKSGWQTFTDSVQQGEKGGCNQAQKAMNQC